MSKGSNSQGSRKSRSAWGDQTRGTQARGQERPEHSQGASETRTKPRGGQTSTKESSGGMECWEPSYPAGPQSLENGLALASQHILCDLVILLS